MRNLPFALQLYSVRDHMAEDMAGTLKRVQEVGYDYVELAGMGGLTPAECKALLDDAGLTAVANHFGLDDVTANVDATIEACSILGMKYAVVPGIDSKLTEDKAGWLNCAKAMDEGGAKLRSAGIQLCYHNHSHEFRKLDGEFIFDIFFGGASPQNLACEIDTYWVKYGGVDPVATIQKYTGRCPLLHIKDMTAGDNPTFAEVGRGIIDWEPIFDAGAAAGAEWYIVEQDACEGDSLDSVAISAEFMAKQ